MEGGAAAAATRAAPSHAPAQAQEDNESEPRRLRQPHDTHARGGVRNFLWLALGATGVVFGDTGTSPLYTFSGIFASELHATPEAEDVKGAFSMIFWVLTWTVCIKYLTVVMRASHRGEGGVLALMQVTLESQEAAGGADAARPRAVRPETSPGETQEEGLLADGGGHDAGGSGDDEGQSACCRTECVATLGMVGCAALLGDSIITPSISVLSAVDLLGPAVAQAWKVALAAAILLCLFGVQKQGSKLIGQAAGPVMVCWFLTIGVLGIRDLFKFQEQARQVVNALDPALLVDFWTRGRFTGFLAWRAMAGVVLSITGAEALYSDMGHFGAKPISFAWFVLVYPSLVLQYMGQAAALMAHPEFVANPFGSTVPPRAKCVLILLAVLATVQASQALISGTFTLFSQARALGLVPRILVVHTNADVRGQVYIPEVNWALMAACICMCVLAQTSQRLAGAYGITVTSTFVVTTLLLWTVLRRVWHWSLPAALLLLAPMLVIDLTFWSSNLWKLFPLGWIPVAIGTGAFLLMHVQRWGNQRKQDLFMREALVETATSTPTLAQARTLEGLRAAVASRCPRRTADVAVYLTPAAGRVPRSLSALARAKDGELPGLVLLLHVAFEDAPFVPEASRCELQAADPERGLFGATLRFGWAEPPGAARASRDDDDEDAPVEYTPGLHAVVRQLARSHQHRYPQLRQLDADSRPGEGVTYIVNRTRYQARSSGDEAKVWIFDAMASVARTPESIFGLQDSDVVKVDLLRSI